MEILTSIISKIIEYTIEPVGRQMGYQIHYKKNFENLRSKRENLDAAKERKKHMVHEEETKGKIVSTDVQKWLMEANGMIQEANKLLYEDHAKTKCFYGVCPNLVSYHQLSRKSTKLAKKIELHAKKEFPSVSYDPPLEEICATPSQNYMAFESRILMVNEIMKELKNPDTNMIRVYGWGGVGKTTLAQEVYRQATKENLFDEAVIVLDVKKYPDLEKMERIQKKIAEKLGMDVDETQDIKARAKHLWNRIKGKNIFVILDDVWEAVDLEALGLRPMATCKILLTSRNRVSEMNVEKEFWLEVLKTEENWSLFEKMVGDVVKDDRIREVATEIAKKCGGLPVSVVAVARSLRSATTLEEWKVALRDFKSFDEHGLAKSAYLALEWNYNQLDGDELKPLFLLCGIIAGGGCTISLSDLLKYAMGLSLVKNVDTVQEARDRLISLVKKLIKDYCLLLDIDDDGEIRMHELVRDVAMGIASKDNHAIAKAYGDELKEWPDRNSLKKCTAISLKSCKIPRLPEVPWVCPELRLFVLENHNIDDSLEIPDNYFEGMKELKVLDVTRLRIPSLPPSLQSLTNLQTLCLDHCVLGDIALVGQLTNLKILSLIYSRVKELPKEMGQLTRLQLLDLTGCSELELIPPGVISSLTSLEDLRMGSFKEWEGSLNDGRSNASVSELKHLHQLTALDIHIPNAKLLPANMFWDMRLERYTILIGDYWLYPKNYRTSSNMLKLKLTTNSQFDQGIKLLLKRCEDLELDGMEAANIISYILASDGGKQLKNLHVQNNDAAVINSSDAFPNLESLSLDNLVNLETVCCGQLIGQPFRKLRSLTLRNLPRLIGFSPKGSRPVVTTEAEEIISESEIGGPTKLFMNGEVPMPNLTSLVVEGCGGLRFLFSSSMVRSLVQLKNLTISNCQIMEEIVPTYESSEEDTDHNMFSQLQDLKLEYLPNLTRFCSAHRSINFYSLKMLYLKDCSKLETFIFDRMSTNSTINKATEEIRDSMENIRTDAQYFLFDEKVGFPSLESLIIYDIPQLRTIWHCQLAPDSFRKLKKIEILRCHNLINIFAPSMMGRLNALHSLKIWQCKSLQVIFDMGVLLDVKEAHNTSRTQLKTFECPNLDLIVMNSCDSLKNIFPASVAKGLQQLSELYMENCGILEEIVAKEEVETTPEFVFSKVTLVQFRYLPQLRSFYLGLHVSKWPLLKTLRFFKCGKVEILASEYSIFQERLDSGTPIKQPFLLVDKGNPFPNLKILHLDENTEIWYEARDPLGGRSNASVSELKQLHQLTALVIHFPDAKLLPANMFSDTRLERYTIVIGDCWLFPDIDETSSNMLKLKLTTNSQFDEGIKLLLKRCEHLDLDGMEAANIISYMLASDSGKQLKNLHVQNNDEVTSLINSSHAFPNLESLSLENLVNLETVCCGQHIAQPIQKLRYLTLRNLPKLIGLSSKGSTSVVSIEAEEIILENEIGGPTKLFMNGEVLMPNITRLILHQCEGLRFLFSCSMAISLVQLTHLEIASCQIMEEIVTKNRSSEENTDNLFRKLKHLQLQHLPSLTRFCSGRDIEFSLLEALHIEDCPRLGTFIFNGKSEITTMDKENDDRNSKENLETVIPHFLFDEKVGFPSLESLIINNIPKLRTIWHGQLAPNSFQRLKIVKVLRCRSLINIFPPRMMGRLNALGTLKIKQCKSLQVVFDMEVVLGDKEAYSTSSTTQSKTFGCPNLGLVVMDSCDNLKNIFPASLAKGLQQLSKLYVGNCGILKEIVAKDGLEMTPEFVFSKVTLVQLQFMPQLRSFYPGLHVSKWPLLKSLRFFECGKVEIFASEYSRFQERLDSGIVGTPIKQPFLLVDKGNPFPNLEVLDLDENVEIWYEAHSPLPAELFINLKEFSFSCAHPQSFHFLEKLHNLEELVVYNGHWKEIFVYEGTSSREIDAVGRTLPHVKNLCLNKMEKLMHLGIGNDNSESVFPNLEILKVYNCGRLKNLTSSAISFYKLTTLQVANCEGLKYLTTYSVAKCLHQLKSLEVENCESMIEIVAINEDEEDSRNCYEIAFSCLQHLKLYYLPSLRDCCSNFTVRVPSLNSLIVKECLIELEISPDGSLIQSGSRPERQQIIEEVEEKEEEEDDGNETGGRTQLIAHTN
ncbi:hypothetical protein GBA52_010083 [Prunus armeniaca]|nr:hypothetical protein GBA52_010083 [Prunus armeniaca]